MNMYAIIWNPHIKDLVIADSEQDARELASYDWMDVDAHNPQVQCVKLDDTLQAMTKRGIMSIREIINHYGRPGHLLSIDDIEVQFDSTTEER